MNSVNNVLIKKREDCSGCVLCATICINNAITMVPDVLGFSYPVVDVKKCTHCGLCLKECSFCPPEPVSFKQRYYALRHFDESDLLKSQSGAAFVIFSDAILDQGGVVYGAAFDENFRVLHKRAVSAEEREGLRFSKYVQSDLNDCYIRTLQDLKDGRKVMFTGTPCQIAGIKAFIPSKYRENLFLVDLICHGVPSPKIWSDYLVYIEKKYGKIKKAYFRDKRIGWNVHKETFVCDKEHSFITFKKLFYSNISLKKCCYSCRFSRYERISDLTIGDFWGSERIPSLPKDNKGISLVLVNTKQGQILFNIASKGHFSQEVSKDVCVQPQLLGPAEYNANRELFEKEYSGKGFLYVAKKYSDLNIKTQTKYKFSKFRSILSNFFR